MKDVQYEIDDNGCWVVTSHAVNAHGYPCVQRNGKKQYVHRYMYMEHVRDIESSVLLRHKCDNPKCCNPAHLEEGSHTDNVRDRVERDRSAKGESNGRTKLTEDQAKFIKYDTTYNNSELSRMFGVSRKAIRLIKQGINWSHI
ncbi:putative DNA binding protein [Bacillus phage BCP8-2]|uniref:Putative DNA binding protein n=1 Tax=Bacillus phage BCP8-2 TaxID=1129192 RepID=A0A0E3D9B9_9CAUD|nr:endonuclease [Bacillus phage BCP8-2]AHJ87065.1 putative DNA binding protein [Bacillus phage BCP8-2]